MHQVQLAYSLVELQNRTYHMTVRVGETHLVLDLVSNDKHQRYRLQLQKTIALQFIAQKCRGDAARLAAFLAIKGGKIVLRVAESAGTVSLPHLKQRQAGQREQEREAERQVERDTQHKKSLAKKINIQAIGNIPNKKETDSKDRQIEELTKSIGAYKQQLRQRDLEIGRLKKQLKEQSLQISSLRAGREDSQRHQLSALVKLGRRGSRLAVTTGLQKLISNQ